jgi:hypothetical protein
MRTDENGEVTLASGSSPQESNEKPDVDEELEEEFASASFSFGGVDDMLEAGSGVESHSLFSSWMLDDFLGSSCRDSRA